ncbi:hypothetical protein WJX74_007571 [Apatococcus lobatus]|uniref:Uncharacterized protein n=2 Tax=Apatococcus TaxID=904362 RepID=A0AAW1T224_9CHLO
MSRYQQEYHLKASILAEPAAVYGRLTDFASLQQIVPNIVHAQGPDGPFTVGTQWHETRNLLFLRPALHLEVTDVQPLRIQWVLRDGHAAFTYTFSLLPSLSTGTTDVLCDVLCTVSYGGTAAARLACFMQQKDSELLQRLKHLLEQGPAADFSSRPGSGPVAVC